MKHRAIHTAMYAGVLIFFVAGLYRADGQQLYCQTHKAMGTVFEIDMYASDEASASRIFEEAFEVVDRIDDELSNYKPTSELVRISKHAQSAAVTTDPETFAFLKRSIYWSRESSGAFDITVGPLLRVWGFFEHQGRVPTVEALSAVRNEVGWEKVILEPKSRSVRFLGGHALELDPGSIGKGFGVDRVVELLRSEGITAAFVSAGGSTLYGLGTPPAKDGWPVIVPDPFHPEREGDIVLLRDESLSTGACTQKFFIKDGHRYCHIFNPRTMHPVEGMLQTSVIDPSATDSDALSTIAFVLPPSKTKSFFAKLPQSRVLLYTGNETNTGCMAIHWTDKSCTYTTALPKETNP